MCMACTKTAVRHMLPLYLLTGHPLSGCCPEDVLQWLDAEKDEAALAAACAQVSNHAGRLLCLLEGSGRDAWLEYAYERWAEVEDALFLRMLDILARENDRGAKHALRGKGRRWTIVLPGNIEYRKKEKHRNPDTHGINIAVLLWLPYQKLIQSGEISRRGKNGARFSPLAPKGGKVRDRGVIL